MGISTQPTVMWPAPTSVECLEFVIRSKLTCQMVGLQLLSRRLTLMVHLVCWIGEDGSKHQVKPHQLRLLFQVGDMVKVAYGVSWKKAQIDSVNRNGTYTVAWAEDNY